MKGLFDMKSSKIPHQNLRRSALASFAIENMKPSKSTLQLADKVLEGKLSKKEAVSIICEKYKVR